MAPANSSVMVYYKKSLPLTKLIEHEIVSKTIII